jgi:thioredoxin
MLLDRPYPLTDESFQRTLDETDVPVLVDFYADWCGPCKMMAPHVDTVANRFQGRAVVAKLNTDLNQRTAQAHQVQGIPTTVVFKNGAVVARQTGALPLAALESMLTGAVSD